MNPEIAYECATCAEIFDDFEEAANCCGKGYYDVFLCGDGRYTCAGSGICPKCTVDDAIAKAEISIKEQNNAVHPE